MEATFELRQDTAAEWASANPVLHLGEPGIETDTLYAKLGDGVTPWNSLGYWETFPSADSAVRSVFGRTGAITAETGDYTASQVGADPSGSASTAESNAETFATNAVATETTRAEAAEALALQKAANLSDLANAGTARTNLGLGSAAVQDATAFDASGSASSALTSAKTYTDSETTRATGAESSLSTAIGAETTRAEGAEALKAPLASPTLTGTPTAPTASASTNNNQIASTAFVKTALKGYAVVIPPSGDTTGATDTANIQAGLTTGHSTVQLTGGQYYTNAPINFNSSYQTVRGTGTWSTQITAVSAFAGTAPSASFLAPAVFQIPRGSGYTQGCQVSDMFIGGTGNTAVGGSTAVNAVNVYGVVESLIENLHFSMNGYAVEAIANPSEGNNGLILRSLQTAGSAGAIHLMSVSGQSWNGEIFITDCNLQAVGTGTGPAANLDAIRLEDIWDVIAENVNGAVSNVSTGAFLHITGPVATMYFTNMDIGCYPNGSGTNPVLLIDASANGSGEDIRFTNSVFQQGYVGAEINNSVSKVSFVNSRFYNNGGTGCVVNTTGGDIRFDRCDFLQNGQWASAPVYDLNWSGTATGALTACAFGTPVKTPPSSGGGAVTNPVNIAAGQNVSFVDVQFTGSGATSSNWFTGTPVTVLDTTDGFNLVTSPVPGSKIAANANTQVFLSSGTWTMPTGATQVLVTLLGAGAGGESGSVGTASVSGGYGGGSGGYSFIALPASTLSSTVSISVGTGGTGGAGVTSGSGETGVAGGTSAFGGYANATGSGAQNGGNGTAGSGGGGGGTSLSGNAASGGGAYGAGGGGGGGISSGGVPYSGGGGGFGHTGAQTYITGGAASTTGVGAAGNSAPTTAPPVAGAGGGGGGASIAGNGGAGGAGGYGSGAGGGGAAVTGYTSGAGGNGGPGFVIVTTLF